VRGGPVSAARAGASGRRVILLGGTSEIGLAIVVALERLQPREVVLAGRDAEALERAGQALRAEGVERALTLELDALDLASHRAAMEQAFALLGGAEIVILAVGVLGARGGLSEDLDGAVEVLQVNTVGAGSLLLHAARRMREAGGGTIVVLSSAAAERPRAAVAVYGASKAGLDSLAQGLGDELHGQGVRVVVVRPGFVHTRMTAGLAPAPLASTPGEVARAVVAGLERGAHTVWAPRGARPLLVVLRLLPRPLLRRLRR